MHQAVYRGGPTVLQFISQRNPQQAGEGSHTERGPRAPDEGIQQSGPESSRFCPSTPRNKLSRGERQTLVPWALAAKLKTDTTGRATEISDVHMWIAY